MSSVSFSSLSTRASDFFAVSKTISSIKEEAIRVSDYIEKNHFIITTTGYSLMLSATAVGGFALLGSAAFLAASGVGAGALLGGIFISGFLPAAVANVNRAARNYFNM
ncbi:MAG: hypothetical protein Q8L98_06835 [Chlamydiales bacterium]|nr:hypothetical protein [Chlamydiales bacterium]